MRFEDVMAAATAFVDTAAAIERSFKHSNSTLPTPEVADRLTAAYWKIWHCVEAYEHSTAPSDFITERTRLMQTIGPVLWKSPYYARSYFKPNGISGDFGIVEMMYDLEGKRFGSLFQSGLHNCLDYSFSTIHSVVAIWERRRWLAERLTELHAQNNALRVLDVPCGGARYIADFLLHARPRPPAKILLVDQDAAALAYVRHSFADQFSAIVHTRQADIADLGSVSSGTLFDVIVSAGMFDYLPQALGKRFIRRFAGMLTPGGRILLTNYHRNDPSRLCKDWGANWPLLFRDESEMRALFPDGWDLRLSLSQNGSLILCEASRHE